MPEYTEQKKEKKKKKEKISEKLENEFQPEEKPKKRDELENDFVPIDDNPNNPEKLKNEFEPFEEGEFKKKSALHKPSQEIQKIKEKKQLIVLEENSELAEMVSIILGDGSVPKTENRVRITLNKTEEPQYRKFVYQFMEKLFKKKPTIYEPKDANAVKMSINSKEVVKGLIDKGVKPGDKKKNQVSVPQWIKKEEENRRSSIRGLVDTDGSIHIHKHNKAIRITFKNASLPLINDYKEMCESFNIPTQKIFYDKVKDNFDTQIEGKKDVVNFIENIKPRKWEYRAKTLGLVLKSISDPKRRKLIENELIKSYPDKKVHYSNQYYTHLKGLCEKNGYNVSDESIFNELENALTYSDNWTGLKKAQREFLNDKAKNVIKDLKKKFK